MVFLKFIFFTLVAVWFAGLIFRAVLGRFLRKNAEAYNRAARQSQREAQRQARSSREGEVTVETKDAAAAKQVSSEVGDYVEFEEITEGTGGNDSGKE